jgi:hypothetical protein
VTKPKAYLITLALQLLPHGQHIIIAEQQRLLQRLVLPVLADGPLQRLHPEGLVQKGLAQRPLLLVAAQHVLQRHQVPGVFESKRSRESVSGRDVHLEQAVPSSNVKHPDDRVGQ